MNLLEHPLLKKSSFLQILSSFLLIIVFSVICVDDISFDIFVDISSVTSVFFSFSIISVFGSINASNEESENILIVESGDISWKISDNYPFDESGDIKT